jgi:hypothetical protein
VSSTGRKLTFNTVIASVAKQSSGGDARPDCFVASFLVMTRAAPAQDDRRALFPSKSRYVSTAGQDEAAIRRYIQEQEDEDKRQDQPGMFKDK